MGKSDFPSHVEWRAHVIVHLPRTRDEPEGRIWNRLRKTIYLDYTLADADLESGTVLR